MDSGRAGDVFVFGLFARACVALDGNEYCELDDDVGGDVSCRGSGEELALMYFTLLNFGYPCYNSPFYSVTSDDTLLRSVTQGQGDHFGGSTS